MTYDVEKEKREAVEAGQRAQRCKYGLQSAYRNK